MIIGVALDLVIVNFFDIKDGLLRNIILSFSFLIGLVVPLGTSAAINKSLRKAVMSVLFGGVIGIVLGMAIVILFNFEEHWNRSILFTFSFIGLELPFDIAEKNNEKN